MNKIYACSNCGVSETNRSDWCDLGCGSDYNEMIEVGGRRFIEYSIKIKKAGMTGFIERLIEAGEQSVNFVEGFCNSADMPKPDYWHDWNAIVTKYKEHK